MMSADEFYDDDVTSPRDEARCTVTVNGVRYDGPLPPEVRRAVNEAIREGRFTVTGHTLDDAWKAAEAALPEGGPCFYCRHDDGQHHTTAVPRWCGECHCKAYAPTSEDYYHALIVIQRAAAIRNAGLDAAWAEVEAALPEGWRMDGVAGITPAQNKAGWEAAAIGPWSRSSRSRPAEYGYGPTPTAALLALAERLQENRDD